MKYFFVLFALLNLSFYSQVSAQNVAGSVEVGVYSAYQFTYFSGGVFEAPNAKLYDISFQSYGLTVGVLGEYHISPNFAILGMIRYEELHGRKYLIDGYPNKLQDGTEIITDVFHEYQIVVPQVAATFLGKFMIPETRFSLIGGVSVGILMNDSEVEQIGLIDSYFSISPGVDSVVVHPLGIQSKGVKGEKPHFADESRTAITLYSGPIYQRTALQLGLTAGLQYDIPLYTIDESAQKNVTLTPTVLFNYNLTTYSDYEKLRAWNVSAGMALKVGL